MADYYEPVPGPQGSPGPQGPQGAHGSQGPQGAAGSGSQGAQGATGAQGASGSQGPQGAAGAQGSQGAAGSQGAQGAQGAAGSAGSSSNPLAPSGALAETAWRQTVISNVTSPGSETMGLVAIYIPSGTVISYITFLRGTTSGITFSHWFWSLYDDNLNLLALTADQGSAVFSNSPASGKLAIATVAGGSASSFTTAYSGIYYIGFTMEASTMPSILGINLAVAGSDSEIETLAPVLCGTSDTGVTTPPSFPHTATAITPNESFYYAYVS